MAIVLLSAIVCLNVPSKHFTDSDLQEEAKFNTDLNEDQFQKYDIMAGQKFRLEQLWKLFVGIKVMLTVRKR